MKRLQLTAFFVKFLYSAYSVQSSRIIQTYWFKKIKILYIFMFPMGNWTTHIYPLIDYYHWWFMSLPSSYIIWFYYLKTSHKKLVHYSDHFNTFSYLALIIGSWKGSSWLLFYQISLFRLFRSEQPHNSNILILKIKIWNIYLPHEGIWPSTYLLIDYFPWCFMSFTSSYSIYFCYLNIS